MTGIIMPYQGVSPRVADDAWIAPTAVLVGDVEIGSQANVWFGCILRGDINHIRIGARTNLQDGTVVHVDVGPYPAIIGSGVTVGHLALVHGCTLEDGAFIGMHATVLSGAVVESGALLAAGALLPANKRVPAGELWAGTPARRVRDLREDERAMYAETADHYVALARTYRTEFD